MITTENRTGAFDVSLRSHFLLLLRLLLLALLYNTLLSLLYAALLCAALLIWSRLTQQCNPVFVPRSD
jgi:hypothetical protein